MNYIILTKSKVLYVTMAEARYAFGLGGSQIPTFHLFDFSFPSLRHVSYIPQFFFLSEAISHNYSKTYIVLVWELSLESREIVRVQY